MMPRRGSIWSPDLDLGSDIYPPAPPEHRDLAGVFDGLQAHQATRLPGTGDPNGALIRFSAEKESEQ
jgi:hypothetical protein